MLENPDDIVATVVPAKIETFDVNPADAEAAVVAAVNAAPAADKKEGEAAKGDEKKDDKKKEGKK